MWEKGSEYCSLQGMGVVDTVVCSKQEGVVEWVLQSVEGVVERVLQSAGNGISGVGTTVCRERSNGVGTAVCRERSNGVGTAVCRERSNGQCNQMTQ